VIIIDFFHNQRFFVIHFEFLFTKFLFISEKSVETTTVLVEELEPVLNLKKSSLGVHKVPGILELNKN